jgi:hypothetical protein
MNRGPKVRDQQSEGRGDRETGGQRERVSNDTVYANGVPFKSPGLRRGAIDPDGESRRDATLGDACQREQTRNRV